GLALLLLGGGGAYWLANRGGGEQAALPTAAPTAPPTATEREPTNTAEREPTSTAAPPPPGDPVLLEAFGIAASSIAPPAVDRAGNPIEYKPDYVLDADPATAWRSRELAPGETGAGEFLEVVFDRQVTIQRIGIIPGYAKVDAIDGTDRFTQNYVIRHIRLEFPDGTKLEYNLESLPELQMVEVPPIAAERFRLVVVRADPPASADPRRYLAISTLEVFGQEAP
ncbi:MAG TPA: hypothetical protein VGE07_24380, partial [Herpetosiphonaceae bacterium]